MSKGLTWEQISNELIDFLDEEAVAPSDPESSYFYARGVLDFAQRLKAALLSDVTPG